MKRIEMMEHLLFHYMENEPDLVKRFIMLNKNYRLSKMQLEKQLIHLGLIGDV